MQDSFLRLYFVRRIPLTESIDSLFLSFVHCLYVIRKFAFSLTDDSRLRHLDQKNYSAIYVKQMNKTKKWRRDWFTNRVLLNTNHRIEHASSGLSMHSQIFSVVFTSLQLNNRNDIVPCNQQYGGLRPSQWLRKPGHLSTLGQCLPDGGHVFKKEDMSSICRTSGNPSLRSCLR